MLVQFWFSFSFFVKIGKMGPWFDLRIGVDLVLEAFDRPASRADNQSTGAEIVRAGRSF